MKISFLFPGSGRYEALDNWVRTIGRHTRHDVALVRKPEECESGCTFVLTETNTYPRDRVDADIVILQSRGAPFGVIHNHDAAGMAHGKIVLGIPTPGDYPSFCWTKRAQDHLITHKPLLLRQPVLPPIAESYGGSDVLVGTFGHIEPKKQTFEMNRWAKKAGVTFMAVGPDVLAKIYDVYLADLKSYGCQVVLHQWLEKIEDLAPLVEGCSHFLFVLTDSKKGTGGSPTSPRLAGLFNRPVIVVDDEDVFKDDGYYVYRSLNDLKAEDLAVMKPPLYGWSSDSYLDALVSATMKFWRR